MRHSLPLSKTAERTEPTPKGYGRASKATVWAFRAHAQVGSARIWELSTGIRGRIRQKTCCAKGNNVLNINPVTVGGENEHLGLWKSLADLVGGPPGHLEAASRCPSRPRKLGPRVCTSVQSARVTFVRLHHRGLYKVCVKRIRPHGEVMKTRKQ